MAENILLTALSPTMERGQIVKWRKAPGDTVAPGDVLCEVETDKAVMDCEATQAGTLLAVLVPAGRDAAVGDPIAVLGRPGEDITGLVPMPSRAVPPPPAPVPPETGAPPAPAAAAAPAVVAASAPTRLRVSPVARQIAAARGLDLRAVQGSGPAGRIVRRDVEQALAARGVPAAAPAAVPGAASATPVEEVPLTPLRRTIAERTAAAAFSAPHYALTMRVTMDGILAARARFPAAAGEPCALNAFLLKFVALALQRHPAVHASWQGTSIRRFRRADIGLAVALADGLITPVVRDCAAKGIAQIDRELKDLITRARERRLEPEEFRDATFTVSNLGSFGIEAFTAIINPPAAAILAVGQIRAEAVVNEQGAVTVARQMRMTLSCDHRVIDGAVGAAFLRELRDLLEAPAGLLL